VGRVEHGCFLWGESVVRDVYLEVVVDQSVFALVGLDCEFYGGGEDWYLDDYVYLDEIV